MGISLAEAKDCVPLRLHSQSNIRKSLGSSGMSRHGLFSSLILQVVYHYYHSTNLEFEEPAVFESSA